MADATADFFRTLAQRGQEPRLGKAIGTVRFDIDENGHTEHWLVTVNRGEVTVSAGDAEADAVFRTDKALFDRAVTGQASGLAAVLRGAASISGDMELLVYIWRLFPGPAATSATATTTAAGRAS